MIASYDMGNKTSKSVLEHSKINREIVDCMKNAIINLAKDVLSEDQEYSLLKEAKSDDEKISKKATDKLSRYFQNSHLNTPKSNSTLLEKNKF